MTNHFEEAEKALRQAETDYDNALHGEPDESQANLSRAHYGVLFANAHTALAGIQSQQVGFGFVGKMADSVEKDVITRLAEDVQ